MILVEITAAALEAAVVPASLLLLMMGISSKKLDVRLDVIRNAVRAVVAVIRVHDFNLASAMTHQR